MSEAISEQESYAKLREMVDEIKVAMLTTVDDDGRLRSRPLQTLEIDANGSLWFFTSASSPKAHEARLTGGEVNLAYANPDDHDYVSISGTAELVRDRARMQELWTDWVKVWFPRGLDDPDLALLRVDITQAEYWDAPGNAVTRMAAFVKARTTGDKDALGDNVKMELSRGQFSGSGRNPTGST